MEESNPVEANDSDYDPTKEAKKEVMSFYNKPISIMRTLEMVLNVNVFGLGVFGLQSKCCYLINRHIAESM